MMRMAVLALLLLAIPAAAVNPDKKVVVVIGDSVAAGLGADSAKRSLFHRLENISRGDWFFLNVSRNGMMLAPGAPLPPFNPQILGLTGVTGDKALMMLGANDFQTSRQLANVAAALDALLAQAIEWSIPVTCVTPIWLAGEDTSPNPLGLKLEDYRAVIRDRCAVAGADVIGASTWCRTIRRSS
jgi:hypothetical protein